MCCKYHVEPNGYFEELARQAQRTTLASPYQIQEGHVLHSGDVGPGNVVPVLSSNKAGNPIAFFMYWGFRAQNGSLLINARSETAAQKPMFSEPWAHHRCIIPASWYYEWEHFPQPGGGYKKGGKFSIQPTGLDRTYLCGIYRIERNFPRFAILTRAPGPSVAAIHDRMPLILPESQIHAWIDPKSDPVQVAAHALTDMICERLEPPTDQLSL